ncbi:MAG: hypothetical protein BGO49_29300 [Planctomycetales bacterium 71-10]|nr:MAG: hypothetical protein BGO49_29300 [Planctomycetales bacterium 71-10]
MSDTGRRSLKGRDGFGRREFLQAGGVGLGALGLGGVRAFSATPGSTIAGERSAILLMLVGGPSQLETFDPKPDAPDDVRGPFGSIATRVPGVRVGEHLPGVAARMDRLALIRSLHHDRAPIHETGLQLMQTGLLSRTDEHPHIGAVASERFGRPGAPRPFVAVPGPIGDTGVQMPRGQTAGGLDARHGPAFLDPDADLDLGAEPRRLRESYGSTRFGRSCLAARKLVEAGARVVTVNMYETVFNRVSWDCHGSRPFSTMDDYRREVLPTFDRAFSALIDDLDARGMLATTLVAAVGEFGRTPRINESGGRDHWPGVWSGLMAGGGVRGGRVVGASDARAAEPADRPVSPGEWLATIRLALGIRPSLADDPLAARPIGELF